MQYLDLTLPTAAENLALDEALLEEAEAVERPSETLRLWEPSRPMVVVGRSSRLNVEVRLDVCRAAGIPVLRRVSGGAAIVAGPGCLMYALVLDCQRRPAFRVMENVHRWVLGTIAAALGGYTLGIRRCGVSDLAIMDVRGGGEPAVQPFSPQNRPLVGRPEAAACASPDRGRKFSGNSARCRRRHLLYHGTLLYDFPLAMVGRCLRMPPRTPDYRGDRSHDEFIANLPLPPEVIRRAMVEGFDARESYGDWPERRTAQLAAEKYGCLAWTSGL